MIFYITYYIFIGLILTYGYITRNKFFNYVALLFIILVSGLRYEVGYDYFNYVSFFKGRGTDSMEPLSKLAIFTLSQLFNNPLSMFFFFSLATLSITYISIEKFTTSPRMALMIYLLIPGLYLNSFSILRQSIAISVFFLALYYLFKNEKTKYFVLSMVAILFHYSAVFPFLLIFFGRKWLEKKYTLKFYLIGMLIAFILSYINVSKVLIGLTGKYAVYADLLVSKTFPLAKVLSLTIISTIIIWGLKHNSEKKITFLLNIYLIGVGINILFANFIPVTRMGYYFLIAQIILVPNIIFFMKKENLKIYTVFLFMIYYFGIQINALQVDEKSADVPRMIPYKNYLIK